MPDNDDLELDILVPDDPAETPVDPDAQAVADDLGDTPLTSPVSEISEAAPVPTGVTHAPCTGGGDY